MKHAYVPKLRVFECRDCYTRIESNAKIVRHCQKRAYILKGEPVSFRFIPALFRTLEHDPRDRNLARPRHSASDVCTAPLTVEESAS